MAKKPDDQTRDDDNESHNKWEEVVGKFLGHGQESLPGQLESETIASKRSDVVNVSKKVMNERMEHAERLKRLRPRTLKIDPNDIYNSNDLIQMEMLYEANTIPDEAFDRITHDDSKGFLKYFDRGGMLNKFSPDEELIKIYPTTIKSVKEELIDNILNRNNIPGKFKVMGLFDEKNVLRASLSYRTAPAPTEFTDEISYAKALNEYVEYMRKLLLDTESIKYVRQWDLEKMSSEQCLSIAEFDTINVQEEWKGSAVLVLLAALEEIEEYLGELPKSFYAYIFDGIVYEEDDTGMDFTVGANTRSRALVDTLGFTNMAYGTFEKKDTVVRRVEGKPNIYEVSWCYVYRGSNKLRIKLHELAKHYGLSDWKGLKKS